MLLSTSATPRATTTMFCVTAAAASAILYVVWKRQTATPKNSDSKTGYDGKGAPSSLSSCIYLDYNGTTPIYPPVLQAMMPYLTMHYGNPSSSHIMGKERKSQTATSREKIDHRSSPNQLFGKTMLRAYLTQINSIFSGLFPQFLVPGSSHLFLPSFL
jgi:Aminotransferase class-V